GGFSSFPENIKYRDVHIAQSFFVPKLCNQCDNPPCVQVCPVGATYKTKDGIVLVDQKRCIGCRYCIQACPYGARYLVPSHADVTPQGQTGVADKCTWCYHRITKGLLPACVEACPVGARIFGDMRDPDSAPRKALRDARVYTLKPALGTKPKVYYIGLNAAVH
ncbi:MAG: 4Fe-4S dicluster domain-containing protein, partial [Chloroflexota bacterium]